MAYNGERRTWVDIKFQANRCSHSTFSLFCQESRVSIEAVVVITVCGMGAVVVEMEEQVKRKASWNGCSSSGGDLAAENLTLESLQLHA